MKFINKEQREMKVKELMAHYSGPILLLGETGTGKNHYVKLLARELKRGCVEVNLSCLSDSLFESELFGHRKGSFTGACGDKEGLISRAQEGILFLDEIAELSIEKQVKLLNFFQDRLYYPVGSTVPLKFKGIIITATNKNPYVLMKEGRLREDFYYRLTGLTYSLPSLEEDPTRIPQLAQELWRKHDFGFPLSPEFLKGLENRPWKGNIRELKYYLEAYGLSQKFGAGGLFKRQLKSGTKDTFQTAKESFEKAYFKRKLLEFDWRVNQTAKGICVSKTTLIKKMKYYSLNQATTQ